MDGDSRRVPIAAWCAAMLLFSPFAYLLSLGPMVMAANHFQWLDDTLEVYSFPAQTVYDVSPPPVQAALNWYVELWDE
jgi:hypothetical protein